MSIYAPAEFSPDRVYRYALRRTWDEQKPRVMFIGLNPSKANETEDDQTVEACIRHAKAWGFGGFAIGNLFAYCDTYQETIWKISDPVGPDNDDWLRRLAAESTKVVAAWGGGSREDQVQAVCQMFPELFCLKKNKSGVPHHPLFIKTPPEPVKYHVL